MKIEKGGRGFEVVTHPAYAQDGRPSMRLVSQSSAIGDYEDSAARPGSSYLWIGEHHHLNREEVRELIAYLNRWLETGRMEEDRP